MDKPAQQIIIYGLLAAIAIAVYSLYLAKRAQKTSWPGRQRRPSGRALQYSSRRLQMIPGTGISGHSLVIFE